MRKRSFFQYLKGLCGQMALSMAEKRALKKIEEWGSESLPGGLQLVVPEGTAMESREIIIRCALAYSDHRAWSFISRNLSGFVYDEDRLLERHQPMGPWLFFSDDLEDDEDDLLLQLAVHAYFVKAVRCGFPLNRCNRKALVDRAIVWTYEMCQDLL